MFNYSFCCVLSAANTRNQEYVDDANSSTLFCIYYKLVFGLCSIVSAAGPLLHINNATENTNFLSLPFGKSDLSIYYLILSSTISVFITPQILNSKFEILSNVFYNLLHYMQSVSAGIFHTSRELSLG
jgi:hypothetical protein